MIPYRPERILIERGAERGPITEHVLNALPETEVDFIDSAEDAVEEARARGPSLTEAKRSLILARFRGHFFKPCPGQQSKADMANVCCDYHVINFASNCHLECTYCFLQSYLNFPYLIVYTNVEDLLAELQAAFAAQPDRSFRVGTGELADSLALDRLTGYSRYLVKFFARQRNALLELKTKSDAVDNLIGLGHNRRTVVGWSVNPPEIRYREELKTSSIARRLAAATRCFQAGYPIAFHFDPLVHYPGWQEGYRRLVEDLFNAVPPSSVAWISLGGLRMPAVQKDLMRQRFPHSRLPAGEFVPAEDGKLRYFKPIRLELYRLVLCAIREHAPQARVYTCMERPEVWRNLFGSAPPTNEELGALLAQFD